MEWARNKLTEEEIKEWEEKIKKALDEVMKDWELTVSSPKVENQIQNIPNVPPQILANPALSKLVSQQIKQESKEKKEKRNVHEEIDKKLDVIKKWLENKT